MIGGAGSSSRGDRIGRVLAAVAAVVLMLAGVYCVLGIAFEGWVSATPSATGREGTRALMWLAGTGICWFGAIWALIYASGGRPRRAVPGHCPGCGYDLAGAPTGAPCPECGRGRQRGGQA